MPFAVRSVATVDNVFVAAGIAAVVSAAVTTVVDACDVIIVEALITRTLDTEEEPWLLKILPHFLLFNYLGLLKN
jgi:hypothetical protein